MVGKELGKVKFWGGHPDTARDIAISTPCGYTVLPQTQMEPLLIRYATQHGFEVRYRTSLIAVRKDLSSESSPMTCVLKDLTTELVYEVCTRFLFGCDGARSTTARTFDFQFDYRPSQGVACNILIRADLDHAMAGRAAQLHWIMNPGRQSRFGIAPTLRMVVPWREWLLIAFAPDATENPFKDLATTSPELLEYIREIIGDDSIDVEVIRVDPWVVRETVADTFHWGTAVFLLGDAAHRHPPAYGLGSNTCIQDAYNLAWKVALVSRGVAGPSLLHSYTAERRPVGVQVVRESNACMRLHAAIWRAMGLFAPTPEAGAAVEQLLNSATPEGAEQREKVHAALEGVRSEAESLGLDMAQGYESTAVFLTDEPGPRPKAEGDPIKNTVISTYPGMRLPHAWLDIPTRRKEISTQDLAGKASFCLLTGHGGEDWKTAAANIAKQTGIPIRAYAIGFGLDWHDVYRQWNLSREVEDSGCVLVRPDRFVTWRCKAMLPDPEEKLRIVFDAILSRNELPRTNGAHHRHG